MYYSIRNIIVLLSLIYSSVTSDWNYGEEGPDVWSDQYPLCAGHSQSPIDIKTACTIHRSFEPFVISSAYSQSRNFILINNGHNIIGTLKDNNSSSLKLVGGGLIGTYQFSSFHFHWGENYKSGSEHQVNSEKYAGEIHFIHINPTTNETAVLGIFLQSNKEANTTHTRRRNRSVLTEWEKYFSAAKNLRETNATMNLNLTLASLINIDLHKFWRYTGSFTTPPCTEGIIWSVFKQPIMVNDNQLEDFRKNLFTKDYRNPQPLYKRIVYRSFWYEEEPSIPDEICCST